MRDDWGRVRYWTACELLSYKTKVGKINEKTSKEAKITLFINKRDHSLLLKVRKNAGLLIFNSLKQKKLIFSFFVNRNWKNLTDSRKRAEILADNRKSHHPIETLALGWN